MDTTQLGEFLVVKQSLEFRDWLLSLNLDAQNREYVMIAYLMGSTHATDVAIAYDKGEIN